jgi:hypothetical protein
MRVLPIERVVGGDSFLKAAFLFEMHVRKM